MAAISAEQESRIAAARGRSPKFRQDKQHPFLINTKDARLYPNTEKFRESKFIGDYRVFTGDPKASRKEREAWLATFGGSKAVMPVVDSGTPFDIGTAKPQEMIDFALVEYGETLDPAMHHNQMRAKLRKLAEQHGALQEPLS